MGETFGQALLTAVVLVLVSPALVGCGKQQPPSSEECKAAIVHMMEVQLDATDFGKLIASGFGGLAPSAEQLREGMQWLKSQSASLVTPEFVAQCVQRMKRNDVECTLSATTPTELVEKCHWKVVAGPRGASLGF